MWDPLDDVGGSSMGQCMSTPAGAPKSAVGGRATYYMDDAETNRSIIEGLAGAYRVIKLLGSGEVSPSQHQRPPRYQSVASLSEPGPQRRLPRANSLTSNLPWTSRGRGRHMAG